jgi:hypothetical protein
MSSAEQRTSERLLLTIPIRVMGFDPRTGTFTEDTYTLMVNRAGALIRLKHRVAADDTIRIVNLESYAEADFRVVGLARTEAGEIFQWGVECLELERNIWGIDFPAPLESQGARAGALLECQGCRKQGFIVLSLVEVDVLESAGRLDRLCNQCGQLTTWLYADTTRRPREVPTPEVAPTPPGPEQWDGKTERRAHRRLPLKVPIRVQNSKGEQEIGKTENVHKGGLAVCLAMKLSIGEIVKVVCPYTEGGEQLEQRAEVRLRVPLSDIGKCRYGMRNLR